MAGEEAIDGMEQQLNKDEQSDGRPLLDPKAQARSDDSKYRSQTACCWRWLSWWNQRRLITKITIIVATLVFLAIIAIGSAAIHIWRTKWNRGDADIDNLAFQCTKDCAVVNHTLWTMVLKECVVPDFVSSDGIPFAAFNYSRLEIDNDLRFKFDTYLGNIQEIDLNSLAAKDSLPFLINAYNSFAVNLIVTKKPGGSIKDIGSLTSGPVWKHAAGKFKEVRNGQVTYEDVSLDNIEHQLIRGKITNHQEPRVHSAVNCASISCPDLRSEAYTAEKLNEQLNDQMTKWMANQGKGLKVEAYRVLLSKILSWFPEDFTNTGKKPLQYVMQFAPMEEQAAIRAIENPGVDYFQYNWNLNSVAHGKKSNHEGFVAATGR